MRLAGVIQHPRHDMPPCMNLYFAATYIGAWRYGRGRFDHRRGMSERAIQLWRGLPPKE